MRRRDVCVLSALAPSLLWADAREDVMAVIGNLAAGLSAGELSTFLQPLSRQMADYGALRDAVQALMSVYDIGSAVELVELAADDAGTQSADLDWSLQLRSKSAEGPLVSRRETVRARLARRGQKLEVIALGPVRFFTP